MTIIPERNKGYLLQKFSGSRGWISVHHERLRRFLSNDSRTAISGL